MRVIRCHVDAALSPGAVLRLPEEKSLHLLRVLRLREGDGVALFNGDGHDYAARITGSERKAVEVTVDAAEPRVVGHDAFFREVGAGTRAETR